MTFKINDKVIALPGKSNWAGTVVAIDADTIFVRHTHGVESWSASDLIHAPRRARPVSRKAIDTAMARVIAARSV